jgi:hypothetical protein
MNAFIIGAASVSLLYAGVAYAEGEGGRDNPFDHFSSPGVVTIINKGDKRPPALRQDPFPFRAMPRVVVLSEPDSILPSNGSEGPVQTANSLPPGFSDSTTAFEQRKSVVAFLQRDALRQEAAAHRAAVLMAQQKSLIDAARRS